MLRYVGLCIIVITLVWGEVQDLYVKKFGRFTNCYGWFPINIIYIDFWCLDFRSINSDVFFAANDS